MKSEILKYDSSFDESVFLTRIDHIYIMVLSAIMANDMSSVSHYLNEDILSKFENLVNEYKKQGKKRLFDEMNIKESYIKNVDIDDNKINVTCDIVTRYMDYFVDENGKYLSGINNKRIELTHRVVFSKLLNAEKLKSARRCPNCGNTININESGVCPYCNSVFNMEKYDYIVTKMELI